MQFTQILATHVGDRPLSQRLANFVAAVVTDPSRISAVMAIVQRSLPLPANCTHVKRVRRAGDGSPSFPLVSPTSTLVLLGRGSSVEHVMSGRSNETEVLLQLKSLASDFVRVAVPVQQSRTREQFVEESKNIWPMGWVQPSGFEASSEKIDILPSELPYFTAATRLSLQAAGGAGNGRKSCVITLPPGHEKPDLGSSAIKDPTAPTTSCITGCEFIVRATAVEAAQSSDPTRTAAALAIGEIARADKELAQTLEVPPPATVDGVVHFDANSNYAPAVHSDAGIRVHPSADMDPKACLAAPPAHSHKRKRPSDDDEDGQNAQGDAGEMRPVYRAIVPGGYVCTGHDAFLSHEPGPLDAMALLHARIARVIYCVPDPCHGALGGQGNGGMRLHELRSLNHHYRVYRAHLDPPNSGL